MVTNVHQHPHPHIPINLSTKARTILVTRAYFQVKFCRIGAEFQKRNGAQQIQSIEFALVWQRPEPNQADSREFRRCLEQMDQLQTNSRQNGSPSASKGQRHSTDLLAATTTLSPQTLCIGEITFGEEGEEQLQFLPNTGRIVVLLVSILISNHSTSAY